MTAVTEQQLLAEREKLHQECQNLSTQKSALRHDLRQLEREARDEMDRLALMEADRPAYILTSSGTVRRVTVTERQIGGDVLEHPISFPMLHSGRPRPVEPWLQYVARALVGRFAARLSTASIAIVEDGLAAVGDELSEQWLDSTQNALHQLANKAVRHQAEDLSGSKLVREFHSRCFDGAKWAFASEVIGKADQLIRTAISHAKRQLKQELAPTLLALSQSADDESGESSALNILPENTMFYASKGEVCVIVVVQPPMVRRISVEGSLVRMMPNWRGRICDRRFEVALPYVVFGFVFVGDEANLEGLRILAAQQPIVNGNEPLYVLPFTNQMSEREGVNVHDMNFCLEIPDEVHRMTSVGQKAAAVIDHFWQSMFNEDLNDVWRSYHEANQTLYDYRKWEKRSSEDPKFILGCEMRRCGKPAETVAALIADLMSVRARYNDKTEVVREKIDVFACRLADDLKNFLGRYLQGLELGATPSYGKLTGTLEELFNSVIRDSRSYLRARIEAMALSSETLTSVTSELNRRTRELATEAINELVEAARNTPAEDEEPLQLQLAELFDSPPGGGE
ncbi:MAG: hypothetical protein V1826_00800 [bacterium]